MNRNIVKILDKGFSDISAGEKMLISRCYIFILPSIFGNKVCKKQNKNSKFIDWSAIGLTALSGLLMWCLAIFYFMNNNSQYITLIIFGFIAISLGYTDFRGYRNKSAIGKQRIARHLTNMLAGTIAVITAALVTNVYIEPVFILWIIPKIVITAIIFWWNRRYTVSNKAIRGKFD